MIFTLLVNHFIQFQSLQDSQGTESKSILIRFDLSVIFKNFSELFFISHLTVDSEFGINKIKVKCR